MPLPNPGQDAVPFTTLTAQFYDETIENIEALADGSGLDDGAVGATKLSATAITLGAAQITSNFITSSTGSTQVTGLSSSVTIPAGGRKVEVSLEAIYASINAAQNFTAQIWEGTVGSGTLIKEAIGTIGSANWALPLSIKRSYTPSSGSKTFNASFHVGGGSGTLGASATSPAQLIVKAV